MKKSILFFILLAFFGFNFQKQKGLAIADQEQGIYIFIRSKPLDYEFLGKINMPEIVFNGKAKEAISNGIRRCKKQFPEATGIIFTNENLNKCEAIKLKD